MGMQFSPMYQPVSTKTIKADGDLNVSPYDVIAYDGKFDTVEADEFVGGVGNFSSLELAGGIDGSLIKMPTLSYEGYYSVSIEQYCNYTSEKIAGPVLYSTPFPISGKISVKTNSNAARIGILSLDGYRIITPTTTQSEYTVADCLLIQSFAYMSNSLDGVVTLTVGIPKLVSS